MICGGVFCFRFCIFVCDMGGVIVVEFVFVLLLFLILMFGMINMVFVMLLFVWFYYLIECVV